jgi:hypothetical protein
LKFTANVRRALHALPETAWQGPGEAGVRQVAEARIRLPGWSAGRRVVFARKLQGETPALAQGQLWKQVIHELAAYVTNLDESTANAWQVQALDRELCRRGERLRRAENPVGLQRLLRALTPGQRSGRPAAAARLQPLEPVVRLLEPDRHVETAGSCRWFLASAARLVESGRQKTLQVSVQGRWWAQLKAGYTRVSQWLASTAPQLKIPPPLPTQIALAPP